MTTIMKPKISASGWMDLVGIGLTKQIEERITSPIIGNGTITSGIVKGIVGAVIHGKAGRIGNIASGAFLVDAGEDMGMALMQMFGGGAGGSGRAGDEFGS